MLSQAPCPNLTSEGEEKQAGQLMTWLPDWDILCGLCSTSPKILFLTKSLEFNIINHVSCVCDAQNNWQRLEEKERGVIEWIMHSQ